LSRVGQICKAGGLSVYAWALLDTHFHLLVRTEQQSLSRNMRKLLTGYVVNFNRRHRRWGHLFQNRYKSIICEEDPYLLELTRYIHLNPIRAGIVKDMEELAPFPWTGHSALMGRVKRPWQSEKAILAYFGKRKEDAIANYEDYLREGIGLGKRPDLVGGGLIRSLGGWSQVLSLRRKGERIASDERVLGSGEFVEKVLSEAEDKEKDTLRWRRKIPDFDRLTEQIVKRESVQESELRGGSRGRMAARARKIFCQLAVMKFGYSGASVARFLGVTTSLVNRMARAKEVTELDYYIK
jgi:REP-associated tyrosine transposase